MYKLLITWLFLISANSFAICWGDMSSAAYQNCKYQEESLKIQREQLQQQREQADREARDRAFEQAQQSMHPTYPQNHYWNYRP